MNTLYALYHKQDVLDKFPWSKYTVKVNLSDIVTTHRSNLLGEMRFFLSDCMPMAEYVGVVNARWDSKYHMLETKSSDIVSYCTRNPDPDVVCAPWLSNSKWLDCGADWYGLTIAMHPTMNSLLQELADVTGMSLYTGQVCIWANDFWCHRDVFSRFLEHMRHCFRYFHGKYGHMLPFSTKNTDVARHPAYFYERCSAIFWANCKNIKIEQIP